MYQKLNGTTVTVAHEVEYDIYEFTVDPPLPVQPGDVLGIFQPAVSMSTLIVEHDASVDSLHFYHLLGRGVTSFDTFIDINKGDWRTETGLPLVSVEISKYITNFIVYSHV